MPSFLFGAVVAFAGSIVPPATGISLPLTPATLFDGEDAADLAVPEPEPGWDRPPAAGAGRSFAQRRRRPLWLQPEVSDIAELVTRTVSRSELLPIYWLRIPKTGSAFQTAVAHTICGKSVGESLTVTEAGDTGRWRLKCGEGLFWYFGSNHAPLWRLGSLRYGDANLTQVISMFRYPPQRAISGWYDGQHDCSTKNPANIVEYAKCVAACQTSMLLGRGCGENGDLREIEDPEGQAIARLRRLGFVGITSEFDLSVCLLHAMYGGECLPAEFANLRPGSQRPVWGAHRYEYNESEHGLGPRIYPGGPDDAIYHAAEEVFWGNIKKYGVNRKSCLETFCPKAAEVFTVAGDGAIAGATPGHAGEASVSLATLRPAHSDPFDFDWPGRRYFSED